MPASCCDECLRLTPSAAAERLGLCIVIDEGPAGFGGTLLLSAWEAPERTIRLYAAGMRRLAETRGCPVQAVEAEAIAHEVLHALSEEHGLGLTEDQVRVLAGEWGARSLSGGGPRATEGYSRHRQGRLCH